MKLLVIFNRSFEFIGLPHQTCSWIIVNPQLICSKQQQNSSDEEISQLHGMCKV